MRRAQQIWFQPARFRPVQGMLALCFLLAASALSGAEEGADFAAVKRKFQQQMASRKSSDRLEALRGLKDYPNAEMVKLVVQRGFKDRDESVRQAAQDTLLATKDNPEVCECLLEMLAKDSHRKGSLEGVVPLVRVLLASNLPDAEDGLVGMIDKLAATSDNATLMLSDIADGYGKKADPSEFSQLLRLTKFNAFKSEFGLRRAVVHAATRYPTKEAVAFLFTVLADEHGELRGDIVEFVTQVTGEKHAADTQAWLKWWQENEKTFEYPKRAPPPLVRTIAVAGMGSYYGIPIYAQRMVFVLDTSGSMRQGNRIGAAKRDLTNAVMGLEDKAYFNMLAFNSRVNQWQSKLVQATPQMKRAAALWIANQDLGLGTASYDALEAALRFDAEAIYFLTDGAPFGGQITAPPAIVEAITRLNRVRRESIYTIGIGVGASGNIFDAFLKALADENYGLYRRVDE
jgi:hypothetical protein